MTPHVNRVYNKAPLHNNRVIALLKWPCNKRTGHFSSFHTFIQSTTSPLGMWYSQAICLDYIMATLLIILLRKKIRYSQSNNNRVTPHHGVSNHRQIDCLFKCTLRLKPKKNIKTAHHLWRESVGDVWLTLKKGQWYLWKCVHHAMTSNRKYIYLKK